MKKIGAESVATKTSRAKAKPPASKAKRSASKPLLPSVRRALVAVAEAERAAQMQAYMKSEQPYHGVTAPRLKALVRELFAEYPFTNAEEFRAGVLALWRAAKFREERYVAMQLTGHKAAREFQDLAALPMYEEMIATGAWWDYVDELAANRIGPLLAKYPREMRKIMLAWSRSDDLWKRRSSIICQLGFGERTDLELLFACIEPSLGSKEFFLRKAIGWALRQLARHDPDAVRRYVREHDAELSGLSKREALKHL